MKKRVTLAVQLAVGLLAVVSTALAGNIAQTPEPGTVLLVGAGLGLLILTARRKRSPK